MANGTELQRLQWIYFTTLGSLTAVQSNLRSYQKDATGLFSALTKTHCGVVLLFLDKLIAAVKRDYRRERQRLLDARSAANQLATTEQVDQAPSVDLCPF